MNTGILRLDLHGKNTYQAKVAVDALLRQAGNRTYRIQLTHGYHGGTALRDFLKLEYAGHPKVKRVSLSPDGGATELILREFV